MHDQRLRDQRRGVGAALRRGIAPFFRGRAEQASEIPGAGLGVSIAREIARAHGGDVLLREAPSVGAGAAFVIVLPVARADSEGAVSAS